MDARDIVCSIADEAGIRLDVIARGIMRTRSAVSYSLKRINHRLTYCKDLAQKRAAMIAILK